MIVLLQYYYCFSTSLTTVPLVQCFTQQNNASIRYDWFIWEEFQDPPRMGFWGYPMSICFLCPPTRNADRLETEHAGERKQDCRVRWLLGDAVSQCGPCKQRTRHASWVFHAKPQEFPLSHTFPPAGAGQWESACAA